MGDASAWGVAGMLGIVLSCIASSKGDAPRYELVLVPGVSGKGLLKTCVINAILCDPRYKREPVGQAVAGATIRVGICSCSYANRVPIAIGRQPART
jgi:hypothetical protein